MSDARLETHLISIAQRYAAELVPPNWTKPGDYRAPLPRLALALADYNYLLMWCVVPPQYATDSAYYVQEWVGNYAHLYEVLTQTLFPSFTQMSAWYADAESPPLVIIRGTATPVIRTLASFVAPYVAARQPAAALVSDYELYGLSEQILLELEAAEGLTRAEQQQLRDAVAAQVRALLNGVAQQRQLTEAKAGLFEKLRIPPTGMTTVYAPKAPDEPQSSLPFDEGVRIAEPPEETDTLPAPPQPPDLPEADFTPTPPPTYLPEVEQPTVPSAPRAARPPQRARPPAPQPARRPVPAPPEPDLADEDNPFASSIPIIFETRSRSGDRPRRPPIPDLPE